MISLFLLLLWVLTTAGSPLGPPRSPLDAWSPMDSDPLLSNEKESPHESDAKPFFAPGGAAQFDSLLSNFGHPSSPLDTPFTTNEKPSAESRSFADDLGNLSPCQKDCSKGLMEAFGLILKSMTHVDRYTKICERYNESYACVMEEMQCGNEDHSMYETMTSGIKYMCVDQHLAFQSTIECIDAQASIVQGECEAECNTKTVVMNWIMRSSLARQIQGGLQQGLQNGLGGLGDQDMLFNPQPQQVSPLDPAFLDEFRQMSSEMCRVGDCVLVCLKNKFDARCEGSAGTLLSEVFVRPIASSQEQMSMISPVMGMFIPQPCEFLTSGAKLAKHRIDPNMDIELRRMYAEKELEKMMNSTTEPEAAVESWDFSSKMPKFESPLDERPTDRILKSSDGDEGESVEAESVEANNLPSNSFGSGSDVVEGSGLFIEGSGMAATSRSGDILESSGAEENVWVIGEKTKGAPRVWRRRVRANETVAIRNVSKRSLTCRLVRP